VCGVSALVAPRSSHATRSQNANDLIGRLLQRDPTVRLCNPALLKAHLFFASIDWAKLADLAVTPPYIPPVVRAQYLKIIDFIFISLII
jgi:hypothetical protein